MKNWFLLFLLLYINSLQGQYYNKFIRFGYAGFADPKGNEIISIGKYDDILTFWSNNTQFVQAIKDGKYYLLHKNGEPVSKEGFEDIFYLGSKVFAIRKNNLYYLMDATGKYLTGSGYDNISMPFDQMHFVYKDKKGGYINSAGKVIIPLIYDYVSTFIGKYAVVKKEKRFGLIDKKERFIIPPVFQKMYRILENSNIVQATDSTWGVIGNRGNWLLKPLVCNDLNPFSSNSALLVLQKGSLRKLINVSGTTLIDSLQYTDLRFYDSLFVVQNNKGLTYYTQNGVVLKTFKNANVLYKGDLFKNDHGEKNCSFEIKTDGTINPLPLFELIATNTITDSLIFSLSKEKKIVILNSKSGKIQEHDFDYCSAATILGNVYYIIQKDSRYGLTDKDFRVLLKPEYTEINYISNANYLSLIKEKASFLYNIETRVIGEVKNVILFRLLKNGFIFREPLRSDYGIMNYRQEVIIPAIYDALFSFDEAYAEVWDYPDPIKEVNKEGDIKDAATGQRMAPRKKTGLISLQNKMITPLQWDEVIGFNAGVAIVKLDGKSGAIDSLGKLILPVIYDEIFVLKGDLIRVQLNGKFGITDTKGKILLPIEYDQVAMQLVGSHFVVAKNSLYGLVDRKNIVQIDFQYLFLESEYIQGEIFYKCYKQLDKIDYYNSSFRKVNF